jgi:hypothetical protein
MRRWRGITVFVVLLFCLLSIPAFTQTVTGTLSGHIADKTGAVIPGVKITALNTTTGAVREATSNDIGYYQFNFLPIGSYEVSITHSGFRSVKKTAVMVDLNLTTVSDFDLEVASVSAEVQVIGGEMQLIDSTTGEIKSTLNEVQVAATPLPGRNFIGLVEQIPGFQPAAFNSSSNNPTNSTGSYASFNGQGTRSATFQIDGVSNDDSSENQNRQNVNISTIKEFQVLTNAYAAEFGRAGGAVILVQTKGGTNKFHGDLYDFIQNDIFNANDWFVNASGGKRPPVRRNLYGGTLGGPIWKNKLFFFGSGERLSNVGKGSMSRFVWLPTDGPRACNTGEVPAPKGPYCVDPATHPHIQRDLTFMKNVMSLWNTKELQGKTPNDPATCAQLIQSGRPNRCVLVNGLGYTYPTSDYTGRLDWNPSSTTNMLLRYQYSRQINQSPRIIMGDNYGTNNNRQYNLGYTLTRVWTPRQTGEFRYGYGNRNTNQQVTDGMTQNIPILRFGGNAGTLTNPAASSDTLAFGGTVIGTSTNVPINRYQRDHQLVYNHTIVLDKHTLRMGIDQRFSALDDVASGTQRGYWTFGTLNTAASILAGTGFTSWELFLDGIATGYNMGYGQPYAQNRFGETNLYLEDSYRLKSNLTLNLGIRWEGVRPPNEVKNRFSYGYAGDYNNVEPRVGIAWSPVGHGLLNRLTGNTGDFVVRAGYGIYHDRVFQSIFSQSGLNFRFQPPNGFLLSSISNPCASNPGSFVLNSPAGALNVNGGNFEVSDPSCGFNFTPGTASRSVEATCSTLGGCNGVKEAGGMLQTSLLLPDKNFHLPYVQQWNLTVERKMPGRTALQLSYSGNRGIGLPFFSGINDAQYPIVSPLAKADVGGGNWQPIVFDRVCRDYTDPMCVTTDASGNIVQSTSGALKSFSALTSTTATLAQKGIVIVNGVPHGYISAGTTRVNDRRPDPTNGRNVLLSNFAFTYYNALVTKVTKATSHGLTLSGWWTWSKTMDTGSEATYTGTDINAPVGAANPQRSLRALSAFHQTNRFVVSGAYELPWMKSQQTLLGHFVGGWTMTGVATFASGLPFTITSGYDMNLDGNGGDRPVLLDPSVLFKSIDAGRPMTSCLSPLVGGRCFDTKSQGQINSLAFGPSQADIGVGNKIPLAPGQNFPAGAVARNAFFQQGQANVDATLSKSVKIREGIDLNLRMEMYNLFNRTQFAAPASTINSTTPLGRISGDFNPFNYVNSARNSGARMGQLAIRLTF